MEGRQGLLSPWRDEDPAPRAQDRAWLRGTSGTGTGEATAGRRQVPAGSGPGSTRSHPHPTWPPRMASLRGLGACLQAHSATTPGGSPRTPCPSPLASGDPTHPLTGFRPHLHSPLVGACWRPTSLNPRIRAACPSYGARASSAHTLHGRALCLRQTTCSFTRDNVFPVLAASEAPV